MKHTRKFLQDHFASRKQLVMPDGKPCKFCEIPKVHSFNEVRENKPLLRLRSALNQCVFLILLSVHLHCRGNTTWLDLWSLHSLWYGSCHIPCLKEGWTGEIERYFPFRSPLGYTSGVWLGTAHSYQASLEKIMSPRGRCWLSVSSLQERWDRCSSNISLRTSRLPNACYIYIL
jgi:hypothetical protein